MSIVDETAKAAAAIAFFNRLPFRSGFGAAILGTAVRRVK
jgi:hypothetical protein